MSSMENAIQKDSFAEAASILTGFIESHQLQFSVPEDEIQSLYSQFQDMFSPDKLKAYSDEELLSKMFLTANSDNNSLCYHLEFNSKIKNYFGSISGGSSFKFGLFQRQEDGKWMSGSPQKQIELSDDEALELGKEIRDFIVSSCEYISNANLESVEDYEKLDDRLNELGNKYAALAWIQKYFQMIFPKNFVTWYSRDWQNHMLYSFGIMPSEKYYGKNGQLALIRQQTNLNNPWFQDGCWQLFGSIKHFFRLGSSDEQNNYSDRWRSNGIVALGWKEIGDLIEYVKDGSVDKEKLTNKLVEVYYPGDKKTASRKAGEIKNFYEASATDTVFVVMNGEKLIGFVNNPSPYYFDDDEPMPHCRKGQWMMKFEETDSLPEQEGIQTSCYEFKKQSNLLFLYSRYLRLVIREAGPHGKGQQVADESVRIKGGENIILYGVPGAGKSWTIKTEYCKDESKIERLVFHPDYMYSDFIGQILPIVKQDKVRYEFSPGPFTKILKKAYWDPKSEYYLIIEEINRGNAPAIFGEVFQLLDRITEDEDGYPAGTSEYAITNANIAQEVYENPDKKVRIPSNLSIIGTMNTSDQNVFTLDTAFQRRWIMRLIPNSFSNHKFADRPILDTTVSWKAFCDAVNTLILRLNNVTSSEDKRLGAYFITEADLIWNSEEDNPNANHEDREWIKIRHKNARFAEKVIKYLWDDAFKFSHPEAFDTNKYQSLEKVIEAFCSAREDLRLDVFSENLRAMIRDSVALYPAQGNTNAEAND